MTEDVIRLPLPHLSFDEVSELHERLALCARLSGLKGHALDTAVARAFACVAAQIEDERSLYEQRRDTLKVVK